MSDAILEMKDVTSGYMGDIDVLRGVSLSVQSGRISGMIGLNGAGKSTLFKTIYGFLKPKSGTVRFAGKDISGKPPHTLIDDGIWYIPQESSLFPFLTVEENLKVPVSRPGPWDIARIYKLFPRLAERKSNKGRQLSGGEQEMLAIARALLLNPKLIMLD